MLFCISVNLPYGHVWNTVVMSWMVLPWLEPLARRRNVASLGLLYRYYFGRCSSELAQLVPLSYSRGRLISDLKEY